MVAIAQFLVPFLFGIFNVQVNWTNANHTGIAVSAEGQNDFISQCIEGGLKVRYRFDMRLCRSRTMWFPDCGPTRTETRSMQYDPISQQYNVTVDTYHDNEAPHSVVVGTAKDALAIAESVRRLPLAQLPSAGARFEKKGAYVAVRAVAECKGESSGIFERIPLILSFGLIDSSVSDSGWVNFDLESGKIISP